MTEKDTLFQNAPAHGADFVFDERVVNVFPDMINRSVPGYTLVVQLIGLLARRHVQAGSNVYDLGCSLGAATLAMRQAVSAPGVTYIAVDNSAAMIKRFRQRLEAEVETGAPVKCIEGDICTTDIRDASMSVLNFTLQFVRRAQREPLLRRIAEGTREGGVLLLSEKIRFSDDAEQDDQTTWHHDFKRAQGYSDLEIAGKRNALERVLQPDTEQEHLRRLKAAGFARVVRCFQAFNFVTYLAFR